MLAKTTLSLSFRTVRASDITALCKAWAPRGSEMPRHWPSLCTWECSPSKTDCTWACSRLRGPTGGPSISAKPASAMPVSIPAYLLSRLPPAAPQPGQCVPGVRPEASSGPPGIAAWRRVVPAGGLCVASLCDLNPPPASGAAAARPGSCRTRSKPQHRHPAELRYPQSIPRSRVRSCWFEERRSIDAAGVVLAQVASFGMAPRHPLVPGLARSAAGAQWGGSALGTAHSTEQFSEESEWSQYTARSAPRGNQDESMMALQGAGVDCGGRGEERFVVLNFYHLTHVDDPTRLVQHHLEAAKGLDIRGRIYISEQGINAQFSGTEKDALAYCEWVQTDPRFRTLHLQLSPSPSGHAFPRLRLRYKQNLVQIEGGTTALPVLDPQSRAVPLPPSEWRRRVAVAARRNQGRESGAEGLKEDEAEERGVVVLDVRNGYEWDVGHFEGAIRPFVDSFRSTDFGLTCHSEPRSGEAGQKEGAEMRDVEKEGGGACRREPGKEGGLEETGKERQSGRADETAAIAAAESVMGRRCIPTVEGGPLDPLEKVDKENTDVLMYCTGGIRCDFYSTLLRQQGFKRLYTLEGGVAKYLKEEGTAHWRGHLFVFDDRLAVHPKNYKALQLLPGGTLSVAAASQLLQQQPSAGSAEGREAGSVQSSSSLEGLGGSRIEKEVEDEDCVAVRCQSCGVPLEDVRHRNCANPKCNTLFLMCRECVTPLQGACSPQCSHAPLLRPFLPRPEPYRRLHLYSDAPPPPLQPPGHVSKRAQKRRLRRIARNEAEGGSPEEARGRQEAAHAGV